MTAWKRSMFCNGGACVEVAYHKATLSMDTANCVEVAPCTCNEVRVRDSKDPEGPIVVMDRDEFAAMTDSIKAGDTPKQFALQIDTGMWDFGHGGVKQVYSDGEYQAFIGGVSNGEFDL